MQRNREDLERHLNEQNGGSEDDGFFSNFTGLFSGSADDSSSDIRVLDNQADGLRKDRTASVFSSDTPSQRRNASAAISTPNNEVPNTASASTSTPNSASFSPKDESSADTAIKETPSKFRVKSNQSSNGKPEGKVSFLDNPLREYASFNCIMSLGALTSQSLNDPINTYRKNGADFTILKSGGGGVDERRVTTAFDAQQSGNLEYFIDDLRMEAILNPNQRTGMSTATTFSFKVIEPYSLGLFLQSLQIAAGKAGFLNYLKAPFLLELDFIGYDDFSNSVPIDMSSRKIPFKLVDVRFDVNNGGSTYEVTCVPWNGQSLADEVQRIKEPLSIRGATVADALTVGEQSLTAIVNERMREQAEKDGIPVQDYFIVKFPTVVATQGNASKTSAPPGSATFNPNVQSGNATGNAVPDQAKTTVGQQGSVSDSNIYQSLIGFATSDINRIGNSKIVNSFSSGSEHPYSQSSDVYDEENNIVRRNGIELRLSADERVYKFPQNMTIQKIIEEMVLISNYGVDQFSKIDNEGKITWFRIEVECYVLDSIITEDRTGFRPRVFVYNVVPYKVHASAFVPPNKKVPGGIALLNQVSKQYDYIYSGENEDVLSFDIRFNTAFFEALQTDLGNKVSGEILNSRDNATKEDNSVEGTIDTSDGDIHGSGAATGRVNSTGQSIGGSFGINRKQSLAKQFHHILLNSDADLITAEIEIWGDPYYIPDTGTGNFTDENSGVTATLTKNGSIDYQRNEVDISINFRTPVDYNNDGLLSFQKDSVETVAGFSGFYKVIDIVTSISGNQFTQRLTLVRRKNQSVDGVSKVRAVAEQAKEDGTNESPTNSSNEGASSSGSGNAAGNSPTGSSPVTTDNIGRTFPSGGRDPRVDTPNQSIEESRQDLAQRSLTNRRNS